MQKQRKIDRRKLSREFYLVLTFGVSLLTLFTVGFLYYQARLVGRTVQIPAFEFQLPVRLPFLAPPAEGSSFTDLFSGTGWLNATSTALYQDFAMTTLSFPPKFEWGKAPDEEISLQGAPSFSVIARPPQAAAAISPPAFIRLQEDGSDRRCIGDECLTQRGLDLEVELPSGRKKISLPIELRTPNLLNISIGVIDKFWLLGGVARDADKYRGYVYKFNGRNFSRVFEDNDFLSPYPGVFGFGRAERGFAGTSDNWLAIYGAYEGIAWQTNTKNSFSSFHNISRFFPIRVMGDSVKLQEAKERFVSFRPEAIRDGKNWYVYSLTSGKPKLIKLVEDEESKISAAWDLTKNLGLDSNVKSAYFALEKQGTLLVLIYPVRNNPAKRDAATPSAGRISNGVTKSDEENKPELWRFTDLGFDKSKPLEAVSSNINTLPGKVVSARISKIEPPSVIASPAPAGRGNLVQFWLSNDGIFWKEAEPYKTVVFTDPQEKLFWRVKFVPNEDLTTSPVLDRLGLEWQWINSSSF